MNRVVPMGGGSFTPTPVPYHLLQRWGLVSVVGIPGALDLVTVLLTELRKENGFGR